MRKADAKPGSKSVAFVVAAGGLAAVTVLFLAGRLPIQAPVAYWVLSVISLIAYALDKSAANRGGQRLSENSLHLFSLLGGWPGALVAQQLFRHKTRKQEFRVVFWATVVINVAVLAWLLASWGARILDGL